MAAGDLGDADRTGKTTAKMPNSAIERLIKYIDLEASRCYDNRSVMGGLERAARTWQEEASAGGIAGVDRAVVAGGDEGLVGHVLAAPVWHPPVGDRRVPAIEPLYPAVPGVGHQQRAVAIGRDSDRLVPLLGAGAARAGAAPNLVRHTPVHRVRR